MPRPSYLRVVMVLGDRDPDLREWCRRNKRTRTAVIRQALRAFLAQRGQLGANGSGVVSAPPPVAASAQPVPASTAMPRRAVEPATAPAPPPAPAPARPAQSTRPIEHHSDERSALRTMLGDFS